MRICLACLLGPGIYSVNICDDSIVLLSGNISVISFEMMTRAIVVVDCFSRCIFAPESAIASMFLLGEFVGVPIQLIKLILMLLISILLIIASNLNSHPFYLTPS